MPRTGGGIYNKPFPDVTTGTVISSAVHNGIVADVETDLNAARPIIAGGTGAVNAPGARLGLQVERSMQTVTNFDSHTWEMGSFVAVSGATAGPPSGGTTTQHYFGIAYGDATNMFVEARGLTDGLKYIRKKVSTWSAWALDGGDKLPTAGGTITGNLTVNGNLTASAGTTTLGTTNTGTTTTGALTVNGNISAATRTLTIGPINSGAISSTTINTNGNTITAGPINAGAITGSTLTLSGNATVNGSIATFGISSTTLNTNGNTITAGNINSSGTVTAPVINATQSDGLKIQVPGGNNARVFYHVAGVRIWTAGVASDGHFKIIDESAPRLLLQLQTDGGVTFNNNPVYAGSFNGPLNGNATSATTAGSFSGSSLSVNQINTLNTGVIQMNNQVNVQGAVEAHGYRQRQGTSGPYTSNGAYTWFNICIADSGAAFEFWANQTNYGAIYMASDYRTKKDVKPLPSMWDRVRALNPVSYTTKAYLGVKADNDERWGMIAHELQDTLIDTAANGRKDQENVVQSPNPMTVIAALTKALQEAMERIEVLESIVQPT